MCVFVFQKKKPEATHKNPITINYGFVTEKRGLGHYLSLSLLSKMMGFWSEAITGRCLQVKRPLRLSGQITGLKFNKCSALFSIFDGLKTSKENFGPT